ncbi:MAG TPA: hypothetical protein VKN76_00735 [Kiloniellaceae bacterium]|nr:hypothetical protein [Kiloniellaceae bacterium]
MDFIFMLTRHDRTVANCLEVLETLLPLGLRHIGFKDIGADPQTLARLTRGIKDAGATSYLEVVSETPAAALRSAEMAVDLGVDRLLGGTEVAATLEILRGSEIAYFPFPGRPVGHPTRLMGQPQDVAADCSRFLEAGAAGADLLAYRAAEADPLALVRAARKALGDAPLIVAGSVDGRQQIRDLEAAGADAFTIGTAVFENAIAPQQPGLAAQIGQVLSWL